MPIRNRILAIILIVVMLTTSCVLQPVTAPTPTLAPRSVPTAPPGPAASPTAGTGEPVGATGSPAATPGPARLVKANLFPPGLSSEPLTVLSTQPADKTAEVAVGKALTSVVVQFNHPVVPLVSVSAQKTLPQPLTLRPPVPGQGEWVNTSTYSFTPTEDLAVATAYTVTVATLKDLLGQELAGYTWTFQTASPSIAKTYPESNSRYAGTAQPITVTFNTAMDRPSTESRFSLSTGGAAVSGRFEWSDSVMRFVPDKPLAYNTSYQSTLKAGAKDAKLVAATTKDLAWSFTTVQQPAVLSTMPANGAKDAQTQRTSFQVVFASPMARDDLRVTIQPTITNYYSNWQYDSNDTILRLSGSWQPSQSYTVTISGQSRDRDGEALAKDTVVRFTTAPLEPQMWLNTAGPMGLYDVDGPQTIYATCINVERVDFSLFRVDRASFLSLINRNKDKSGGAYTPASSSLVRSWSQAVSSPLNASSLVSTTLSAGPLQPGIYYLQAGSPNVTNKAGYLLVATRYNLLLKHTDKEALLWVTSLATGKPVAGAALTLLDTSSNVIATGASDADGLFHTPIQLTNPYDSVYAVVESDGQVVAAVGSDWANGINPWDFNLPASRGSVPYYGQMDTDRAIYQPGQSVFYKGILRADDDAVYSLPNLDSVIVEARDFQGRQVFSSTMPLSPFGTFNGEIKLAEGASTGGYVLSVKTGNQADDRIYASMTFQVAEYRRPEFQVAVSLDKPEYVNGDTISATATASYFFGGAVADAAVTWRLMSEDYFFSSDLIKGYWDFSDWDYTVGPRAQGKVLSEGKGKTDKQGGFSFSVPADLSEFPQSQSFTLEADVTDINNQAVASRTTVIVHKGQVYIGLRPQRYVGSAGEEQAVDVISVDTKGITVANQAVTVSFYQREWYSARVKQTDGSFVWQSAYTDTFAFKDEVKTDANGAAVAAFTPLHGGTYRAVADAVDARGNKVRSATYLWVSDSAFVNWRMDNNDRVDLIADKKQYAPGETADILVPAPFANAEALLTIERGSIREVRRLFLTGNSERVQIPILPDYAPNVYVSILMVKGRGPDSPLPQFKLGYVNLSVSTQEKQLSVKLTPDRAAYSPGDKATFSLEATDYTGKPVQAEFSLALVDKAVQSLADSHSLSPLQAFYGERSLSIVSAVSWSNAVERLNQTLRPEGKGGGGGDAQDGSVRRDFKDTAYWNPSVVTDKTGRAQVTVTLPDNLTTWNMAAKGVTSGTLVGQASADILSSKDLLVRPVIPRFFVVGDKARLEAVVNNNTGQAIAADVRLDAQGLTVAGNAQQSMNIPANDKAKVGWDVTVAAVDQVVLTFSASGGGRQDALEQTLPVRRPTSPETVATAGQVETKIAEQIRVPAAADTSAGELRIALSPSLAAASNDSLRYLESYAYESSEQTASKLLPNVATYQALRKLGIERPDLKQSLAVNTTRQVQRLYALQNQDGGWGWWGGETSRPVLTAYALLALYSAQQGGFAVDPGVLSRAEQFLNNYLNQPIDAGASYVYNERAFAVFVLTEIGSAGTSSRAVNIFDQRASLDIYAKAYLLLALDKLDLPQAKTILAEIGSAAIASATGSHWEEKQTDYWGMNTNTRTTALVIMALARADSKNANLASAVRWLMTARKGDHWQTTQETAWSVLALTEFMVTSGELQARYTYQVTINDKPLGSGAVDENNVDQTQEMSVTIKDLLQATGNDLTIIRSPGSGQLYYSAYLNYYLPADTIAPLNRGIVLGRQYFAVDGATLQPTDRLIESAVVGDYVQVKLTLVAPADLHYLILEDALPAGFEAVDTTLKTSSAAANSPEMMKDPSLKSQSVVAKGWFSPYWQYWTQSEIRDDRVVLFATSLGRGVYEYTYIMRASLAGQFRTLPAQAWETYFPDVFGRSDGTLFTVQ